MILKWKTILTNWMNCYTSETEKIEQNITPENLLNIFTHIHESFRLDDSKSSKFEANTIQDFIIEKYPGFKFDNGTLEVTCEEEVYIVASLLLFFICVNSKNAEMKRAMCSKLSAGDQETIMKFSKSLLDCSPILYVDVETAITEACGPDASAKVAETPPALRSLHGEVRRLQAALDAERFDRNYLQDELARTNLKLEKLTKVKEQYKLDILNLKAKISLCCGEKREQHREARADEFIARLQRQLQELEARLEDTLSQLDDVQQERDTYKEKVAELKQERDKWLSLSQQEADRAGQLADQLDTERRTVATLRDLVSELRQHNRNNGLDSSMLECDDPDTSIQSLSNLSVCNEVCANVIEVQLGEERAKIEILKQQIQNLQEQLAKAGQNFESEKLALETVITEKDGDILNLKQLVREEIQEKNNLQSNYEQEINKLNRKMFEMSQLIKDLEESSKHALEEKIQEMQTMQEHFIEETDKLGDKIKKLQNEVEEINNSKRQCDKEIVKLNNKITEMSQTMKDIEESSKRVLGEKEQEIILLRQKFTDEMEKASNMITTLEIEIKEQNTLKTQCDEEIYVLSSKIAEMSQIMENNKEKSKHMLEEKENTIETLQVQLSEETEKSSKVIKKLEEKIQQQIDIKTNYEQEIAKLNHEVAELCQKIKDVKINSQHLVEEKEMDIMVLQRKLSDETEKSGDIIKKLQADIAEQNNLKIRYEQEIQDLNDKIVQMSLTIKNIEENSKIVLTEKVQEICSLKQQFAHETKETKDALNELRKELKEQINLKNQLEHEAARLNDVIVEVSQNMHCLEERSNNLLTEKENALQTLQQKHSDYTDKSCQVIKKLKEEIKEQNNTKAKCDQEIEQLKKDVIELIQTSKNLEENTKKITEEKKQEIKILQQQLENESEKTCDVIENLKKEIAHQCDLKVQCEEEISQLNNKVVEILQQMNNVEENSKCLLEEKEQEIRTLQQQYAEELEKSNRTIKSLQEDIEKQSNLKTQYEHDVLELKNKIVEISQLKCDLEETTKHALEEKEQEIQSAQQKFSEEIKKIEIKNKILEIEILEAYDFKKVCDQEIVQLNTKIVEMSQTVKEAEESLKLALEEHMQEKVSLSQQFTEDKKKLDNVINDLNKELAEERETLVHLKDESQKQLHEKEVCIEELRKEVEQLTISVSNIEKRCQHIIEEKQKEILSLNKEIAIFKNKNNELSQTANDLQLALEEKVTEIQQFTSDRDKLENINKNLKIELEAKNYAQLKLKDEFDNLIMKLNEKVLNRNNELVELQNNVIQKSEFIEVIQSDLRREKELRDALSNTCNHQLSSLNEQKNAVETDIQQKLQEISALNKQLGEKDIITEKLNKEIENLKTSVSNLEEKCRHRDSIIKEKQKEIEFLNDVFQKELEKLNHKVDERNASIKSLQMQLHNEIEYKLKLQNELSTLDTAKISLSEELNAAKILMKDYEEKTLAWEKQKHELEEQIQANIKKVNTLEEEKTILLKDMKVLQDIKSGETKDHEEKILMLEKHTTDLKNRIQANNIKVQELEDEKASLLREVEELKGKLNIETKNYEEKTIMWENQKTELEEQIRVNLLKVDKLEEEKVILVRDLDKVKVSQLDQIKDYEDKCMMWETQTNDMKKEIQCNILKIEKLEDEKAVLLKEQEVLKSAQSEEAKNHAEIVLMWENQKLEMNRQIQSNAARMKELQDENAMLMKEMEALKAIYSGETKDHEENKLKWEKQTSEWKEKIHANILMIEKLETEKADLAKEVEDLKISEMERTRDHEEKALMWVKQKMELDEQIRTFVVKVENLEDEKAMLLKEMEALKTVQTKETQEHEENLNRLVKQTDELKEQINANILNIEKLESEKAELLKEIEERQMALTVATKAHEENTYLLQKGIHELKEQIEVNVLKIEHLEEEKMMLVKEMEVLKAVESGDKEHQEKEIVWQKEKVELNDQLRANLLKAKELEEKKEKMLKTIEELMAAQMDTCFKKEHEEKILLLEKKEKELKEQMQADSLKVDMLEQEKVMLLKELEALKAAQKEMMAAASQERITGTKQTSWEKESHGMHHQVDTTTSDLAHSSMESLKTISDLEKIIQDKNRKITSMQIEISYIKSMMAESGIKLIDVSKELEVSKDTCQELSSQLKKLVQQKNEEISELKRQVAKMSATENRASQIIKLSAKYQAMILKRIAEIKSSAVLKELTNFGNQNSNGDDLRRSIGSVTMEDLENFLETTDRHLKRCSEKQIALQKDRDRLSEVNRINESEIINMKKFLTEMSVSFRTFTTVKEVYNQKLSKIVSLQRSVRRDILNLDGRITEATMCKLERGYAAVMQDLSECAMNLERWVDRSVSRLLSSEKIKQAFTSDMEQASLSTCNYQNAAVEVQLSELENSFQKLLAEIDRAQKGEGARTAQEVTIMEVRAEYEDKLSRMKSKMKELFHEEMGRLKKKQADEIAVLERELVKSRDKLAESSRAYEQHIRALTTELWSVGEKFLVKQEEADWLRKTQSGSLMSLQHVHSSGLHPPQEVFGRPSDTHSLRSLPVHTKKSDARGLHMSDEEGEVFDNRFLKELSATPRASLAPGQRISELKRRNSLVPPHLKSSYPAEMQFAPTLDEEDIKCAGTSFTLGRPQRKEVGITAYKKPGPPTPSKQAGRLSATDSELRESLRVDADPGRKTSTPSRIRSLFRSNRNDTDAVTPRSRRFSNMFRKK